MNHRSRAFRSFPLKEQPDGSYLDLAAVLCPSHWMALTETVGAQTGASDRLTHTLTAPPGAHSTSSAPVHPSGSPRELASPAQPPAQGDGRLKHAPVLRESTMALTESVGALRSSVPLPWQHEDRGQKAAESLPPVPGAYFVTGDSLPFGCSWTGSPHAPAGHSASLATPGSPDPGSNARPKLPPNSSWACTDTVVPYLESYGSAVQT
jgi:hypothetical protein